MNELFWLVNGLQLKWLECPYSAWNPRACAGVKLDLEVMQVQFGPLVLEMGEQVCKSLLVRTTLGIFRVRVGRYRIWLCWDEHTSFCHLYYGDHQSRALKSLATRCLPCLWTRWPDLRGVERSGRDREFLCWLAFAAAFVKNSR